MKNHLRRPGGEQFPYASMAEALPHLRRPPTPVAVQFKIQNAVEEAAQVAAYIDARLVFDRLDHVCGQKWWATYEALPGALIPQPVDRNGELRDHPPVYVRCRLTLYSVTREDVGEGQDPKAAFSDAIKRAAVHFGVGRALYAMRLPWLREGDADSELRRDRRAGSCSTGAARPGAARCSGAGSPSAVSGSSVRRSTMATRAARPGSRCKTGRGARAPRENPNGSIRATGVGGRPYHAADPRPLRCAGLGTAPGSLIEKLPSRRPGRSAGCVRWRTADPVSRWPGRTPRGEVARWRRAGCLAEDTVAALASLLFDERRLERLDDRQVGELALCLEFAARGRVGQGTLARALTRLSQRDDREEAARTLRAWLIQRTNEREALGRRRAA
jgi:hypothetical protein